VDVDLDAAARTNRQRVATPGRCPKRHAGRRGAFPFPGFLHAVETGGYRGLKSRRRPPIDAVDTAKAETT
jgi:hypothetical protein